MGERLRRYEPDVEMGDEVGFYVFPLSESVLGVESELEKSVRSFGGVVEWYHHDMTETLETRLCVDMRELGRLILPANCFEWREGGGE